MSKLLEVVADKQWWLRKAVVVCGSIGGNRVKFGENKVEKRKWWMKWCCGRPNVRACGLDVRGHGPDVWAPKSWTNSLDLEGKENFWGKTRGISWMELGKKLGEARSTCNTSNPCIKFNKTSSHQQITKKIGTAIFVGIFKIGIKHNKIRLENKGGDSKIMINMAHDTKMMYGGTLGTDLS
jgi:hypothetical protein